jgi:hypothetical protein
MLHRDYDLKASVENKKEISGHEAQGSWPQEDMIGDKLPVVK